MADKNISDHDKAILNRIFNPNLPYEEEKQAPTPSPDTEQESESAEIKESKRLEFEGVEAAESGDLVKALNCFNQAVEVTPERASCYNNRAQLLRIQGNVQGAVDDLNKAIMLSEGKGQAACQAYTQRGLIERLEGHDENAMNDFKKASCLGGEFAKQQVIAMNPYAAMCNQMLSEVIGKLRKGEEIDE